MILHVVTKKGKGYQPAEDNPGEFHGIGQFDIDSGEPISSHKGFSAEFGKAMCELAETDKKLCAITAAMSQGTGLSTFARCYRDRFFDVGIAEEHAVTFGCGLAAKGMRPVFAVYSTFLQRSYDQLIHDAALAQLHLTEPELSGVTAKLIRVFLTCQFSTQFQTLQFSRRHTLKE